MRLQELLKGVRHEVLAGNVDVECSGVFADSRQVRPGGCFVCVPGTRVDGHAFAAKAVQMGAAVLVVSRPVDVRAKCIVRVDDTRRALSRMAANWFDNPSMDLAAIAVTGSDGKTSTTFLIRAALQGMGIEPGLMGTILREWPGFYEKADMTTPDPLRVQAYLAAMRKAGARAVVMEASSHALDQGRLVGLQLDVAVFTNLTRDHLDYHRTVDAYAQAKSLLFSEVLAQSSKENKACVLNRDDPRFDYFAQSCPTRVLDYGFDASAAIHPDAWHTDLQGTQLKLVTPEGAFDMRTKLTGRHNIYNIMAAAGVALALGGPMDLAIQGIAGLDAIPGRLQRVDTGAHGPACFVDYAHTPAALSNVIGVLKPLTRGRLIVVFGAGGDRDRGKRPLMGRAACAGDYLILTSDNPRTEDPMTIIDAIETGVRETAAHPPYVVVQDRRQAICRALAEAGPDDTVLIAGKGHEDYQIIGTKKRYFDDVETVKECIKDAA